MRLRQIKLAGFKSFVDPTQIDVPGSLVGVVGPNGCGKSNVIDAVRWVLGESKAAELRGESMQDVIFNGAANRKPAGRASVELLFDNHDGRIQGEWGKYAELSVKRVLTRDGASSYYINNQTVRRRDVHDLFLGTGVGPRAYAIIGQGMISRIVEARPEDLRVFLEEAAGVSRYKERRKETENRLADTRDNLTRVEDILRELDGQIVRLEEQSAVASKYQELKLAHDETQAMLWLARRREAQAEQERALRDLDERGKALEAHVAELRATEAEVESTRAAHYAASDALHAEQGALMQVTSEIGKLETELRALADSRARQVAQIESRESGRTRRLQEGVDLDARLAHLRQQAADAEGAIAAALAAVAAHEASIPALESAYAAARDALAVARSDAAVAQRAIEGAAHETRQAERQLTVLAQRRERLEEERIELGAPDDRRLEQLRADAARLEAELRTAQERLAAAEAAAAEAAVARQAAVEARDTQAAQLAHVEARLSALRDLQARVEADEKLDPWLRAQGLESLPRLFRKLQIDAGWEVAVEALLRERVDSLEVGRLDTVGGLAGAAPPARVAFYSTSGAAVAGPTVPGLVPLAERLRGHDAALAAAVGDWLAGVYVADSVAQALAMRTQLPAGGQFVVREGHVVSRFGVRFYAADDPKAGMLARRREIEHLEREARAQKLMVEQGIANAAQADATLREAQAAIGRDRAAVESLRGRHHAVQLESVRLGELVERVRHRTGQIDDELEELAAQEAELQAARSGADAHFQALDAQLVGRQEAAEAARVAYEQADAALRAARVEGTRLAGERQRLEFERSAAQARIGDVTHAAGVAREEAERLAAEIEQARRELATLDDASVRSGLDQWLSQRTAAEERVREARSRLDELAAKLKSVDERRLGLERELEPRRQKLNDLQLKEQAARLAVEQFAAQLAEAKVDEAALAVASEGRTLKPAELQVEIGRLAESIAALGNVNLAALDELGSARERKGFLDAQSSDLRAAIDTLVDAIKRIDGDTRELLGATFERVNSEFGVLFPKLFGGGEARLIMTGEEILDAGVQVMAQPPGKRNSTIHLLSGGEKALTATALVFALFKLNPAPFCLLDEVDAPLDDANTDRFCNLVRSMTAGTQFLFITHNKIAMEMAEQLIGVTMQEQGVSRIVAVDIEGAARLAAEAG